jgi:hypothetical protein
VTLYRPGVYSDGQPAESVWHLVVDRAHAFDPVWRRAVDAIAARLVLVEPEATAPTIDDLSAAFGSGAASSPIDAGDLRAVPVTVTPSPRG